MEEKKQKAGKRPLAGSGGGLPYDWCTTNCPTNNIFTSLILSSQMMSNSNYKCKYEYKCWVWCLAK